jgi:hypothetical protein
VAATRHGMVMVARTRPTAARTDSFHHDDRQAGHRARHVLPGEGGPTCSRARTPSAPAPARQPAPTLAQGAR